MDSASFSLVLAALGLACLWLARNEINAAWRQGSRLQAISAQVLVTGGMLGAATFVADRRLVQIATTGLLVYLLALIGLSHSGSRRAIGGGGQHTIAFRGVSAALLMATWAWLYAVNIWSAPIENEATTRVVSGVTLLLFLIVQGHRPINALQFYSASLLTICAIAIALPFFPDWFAACDQFKCNAIESILRGPFASGNLLGVAAAMCGALLMASTPFSGRMVFVLIFLALVLYGVYSRTSQIAVVVTFVLLLVELAFLAGRKPRPVGLGANLMGLLVAAVPMAIGLFLIFTSKPDDFSDRGNIWARGREAVSENVMTGRGIDSWKALEESGLFGQWFRGLFTHSQYLLIYFSGGVIGLALFFASLFSVAHASIRRYQSLVRGAAVPLTFGICGIFEAVWNPLTIDESTWVFFALTAGVIAGVDERDRPAAPRSPERRRPTRPRDRLAPRELPSAPLAGTSG